MLREKLSPKTLLFLNRVTFMFTFVTVINNIVNYFIPSLTVQSWKAALLGAIVFAAVLPLFESKKAENPAKGV